MAQPGDLVYQIGTIHVNLENGACVVEVGSGIQAKDGKADLKVENIVLDFDTVKSQATALQNAVRTQIHGKLINNKKFDNAYVAPKETPKAEEPTK